MKNLDKDFEIWCTRYLWSRVPKEKAKPHYFFLLGAKTVFLFFILFHAFRVIFILVATGFYKLLNLFL